MNTYRFSPWHLVSLALMWFVFSAVTCTPNKKVGEPCEKTGEGFTSYDPCAEMCLGWEITCPNGKKVTPGVCSGAACGGGGSCPSGQVCLQVDSFAANSRCVPASVCGQNTSAFGVDSLPDGNTDALLEQEDPATTTVTSP
jgi:hypothetical protein